jgi:uncharacterized damage-inducible protein DinB
LCRRDEGIESLKKRASGWARFFSHPWKETISRQKVLSNQHLAKTGDQMSNIQTKTEIIAALQESGRRAHVWFEALPADQFFIREGETWSPSDNVDHMIRAIKPIIKALKLPRVALQTLFGKPDNASKTYDEICTIYAAEIAKGAKAAGSFLPDQGTPAQAGEKKKELLEQLSTAIEKLASVVETWEEEQLDEAQLPHPIIGKITVREMLFFTIHHNLRHASLEGD